MSFSHILASASRLLLPALLGSSALADVIYVDASGNGQFATIQQGIDAAADGDVLLVRGGTYAGFTLDNRSLWIVADAGAAVKVNTTVTIRNLAASASALLSRLEITGAAGNPPAPSPNGLNIENNAGHVRVQSCTLRGGPGVHSTWASDGGAATSIVNSSRVAFATCSMIGGNGGGYVIYVAHGGFGGHGAVTQGSSVAFYDCALRGGVGGLADYLNPSDTSGDGGDGCRVLDYGILASNCSFNGGWGGGGGSIPGNGGGGLAVIAGQAQLIASTYSGGMGGLGYYGTFGQNGSPQSGPGVFNHHPGSARKLAGPVLAGENGTLKFDVNGAAGDRVWLFESPFPDFVYSPANVGVWLLAVPILIANRPRATLPANGFATITVPAPNLAPGTAALRQHWQCVVMTAAGALRLGSPQHVAVLNCSDLLPDCNGNGSCDSCDLLLPTTGDCNHNGVPDACEPDCNANGIADACDIANGTSPDVNQNGIPDECEPVQSTWHVDDSAAPGGNGSAALPFQTLGSAFSIALSGDTVLVANGLYQGPANRNLDFGSRRLVVRSSGGAANCVINCLTVGRAFKAGPSTDDASLLEGFTILNGMSAIQQEGGGMLIQGCNLTVRACRFEYCQTPSVENGGGMKIEDASPLIDGCVFVGNRLGLGSGAAAYVRSALAPRFKDCNFVGNVTGGGGALYVAGRAKLERCLFASNVGNLGGAIFSVGYSFPEGGDVSLDQCCFAGNSAAQGGALYSTASKVRFTNCTIVDNRATDRAGAFYFGIHYLAQGPREWRNTVIWNNTSPNGTPIHTVQGPVDFAWCSIEGGAASVTITGTGSLIWGSGNQTLDPQFSDRDGLDNNPLTIGDNDYRLSLASPCVDAGANGFVAADEFDLDGDGNTTEPVPFDFDGSARFVDVPTVPNTGSGTRPIVDLGAWELP